ncbi:hypothetical protein BA919_05725 [Helicobacter pullorum]|uniref:hypothetical protein n=1 Tax=Helicobacter pullorum TaxID=35818 RepID=UPI0008168DE8|nr:hypothetical protein [Helicobacter pullorum]OCR14661.1 hypothetical protein BA919_05725 [Helicobacter pullorum]
MQIESLNNTSLCNTNTMAFIEELLNLEYLQDTINEVGNFLTQHIAKDYGFSVNLNIMWRLMGRLGVKYKYGN